MILYETNYEWYNNHHTRTLELKIIDGLFILNIHWRYNNGGNTNAVCMNRKEFEGVLELMYQALIEEMKK